MISPESYWDALHEMPEGIRDCLKNAQLTEKESWRMFFRRFVLLRNFHD